MTESHDETNPADRPPENPSTSEGEVPDDLTTGDEPGVEFGAGKGPAEADSPGVPDVMPGPGGYAGRDPKTEMPRVPSVPETQDDSTAGHDAAPSEARPERERNE